MVKYFGFLLSFIFLVQGCGRPGSRSSYPEYIELTRAELADKIKGGWAGQAIGCTYGGPTEFQYKGTMIQEYTPIKWDSMKMKWWFDNFPGLYDDLYMDLTFVEVFEKHGLDAPALKHGNAIAKAEYRLWHANQVARYNILNGIYPPHSGYWENNPHADDIDFQIEADFAGLMSPAMINTATSLCDSVGHIMNYGDGWYGGVFVASMYSFAFWSDSPEFIVREALRTIPEKSKFYQCIHDVFQWYEAYPHDWKRNWFELQKKWSSDIGCPKGVFDAYNIDAKINSAYVVLGLLYGNRDFGKSLDIATRCGQDSDCNPSTVGGILGTVLGYDQIPNKWKKALVPVEDINFSYTDMSLNDVYTVGMKHALALIRRNGGEVSGDSVKIKVQVPEKVRFEQGFENCYPVDFQEINRRHSLSHVNPGFSLGFEGNGFVLTGNSVKNDRFMPDRVQEVEVYLDGKLIEVSKLPTNFIHRKLDVAWKYNLESGQHTLALKLKDPQKGYRVQLGRLLVYDAWNKKEQGLR